MDTKSVVSVVPDSFYAVLQFCSQAAATQSPRGPTSAERGSAAAASAPPAAGCSSLAAVYDTHSVGSEAPAAAPCPASAAVVRRCCQLHQKEVMQLFPELLLLLMLRCLHLRLFLVLAKLEHLKIKKE